MRLFKLEHGRFAYRADFVVSALSVAALLCIVAIAGPPDRRWELAGFVLGGFAGWSLIEYAMHRFVLHGLRPFRTWHEEHHRRPAALIGTPTIVVSLLFAGLVFVPAVLVGDVWFACATTAGILAGYFAFTVTHHAMHHGPPANAWLARRKRWHALHHRGADSTRYGVTSAFWDHVFSTAGSVRPRGRP
jgi:cyclopropane-fatty-acyl-phospholipid synthase